MARPRADQHAPRRPSNVAVKASEPTDEERRRGEVRFEVGVEGDLCFLDSAVDGGGHSPTLVHDVSQQGLRLSTRTPIKPGATALVRFALPGGQARTRTVAIRWVKRVGSGFEAGAEAAVRRPPKRREAPADEDASETYYEAEADFVYDDDKEPPTPLLPSAGQIAKVYQESNDDVPEEPAGLPVKAARPRLSRREAAPRVIEADYAKGQTDKPLLEYLALGLAALAAGSAIALLATAL